MYVRACIDFRHAVFTNQENLAVTMGLPLIHQVVV
jgi:hypothetical protein